MSEAYISQVMAFGFGFAPKNWALCNGQILSIQQNTAMFSLLGTTFGGNGQTTFGLPNLQGRVPLHRGTFNGWTYQLGEVGGAETVTITTSTMPAHTHGFFGTTDNASNPQPTVDGVALAKIAAGSGTPGNYYAPDATPQILNPTSLSTVGGNQAHANLQPYLTINWCICQYGIYPSRN